MLPDELREKNIGNDVLQRDMKIAYAILIIILIIIVVLYR